MNITEYVKQHRIEVKVTSGPKLTKDADGWEHNAYRLRLSSATMDKPWNVDWKQGTGIETDPTLRPDEVFDALVSEAAGADNARSFEEWCGEYGYDTDSRKAEATYRACVKERDRLIAFLGSREEFLKVAYEVERL